MLGPVLVTVLAPRTAKVPAHPRTTGNWADAVGGTGGGGVTLVCIVTALVSNVTAAFCANALPSSVAPVAIVMEAYAITVPLNAEYVPSVAELPTCQNTLAALAPPLRTTRPCDATVSPDPIWKMKTAFGLPLASRVRSPVIASVEVDLYRPGARVCPPKSPATSTTPTFSPAAVF